MQDVAARVGRNMSTISRVVSEKYVQTPDGIFALKFFFSQGIKSAREDLISNKKIRFEIEEIVREENEAVPLRDGEITARLKKKGINISRRTVAKYRKLLHIPPAYLRRQLIPLKGD